MCNERECPQSTEQSRVSGVWCVYCVYSLESLETSTTTHDEQRAATIIVDHHSPTAVKAPLHLEIPTTREKSQFLFILYCRKSKMTVCNLSLLLTADDRLVPR
jgi:hypothetical protein